MDTAEGSLSNSSTSTSLDTVVLESARDNPFLQTPTNQPRKAFSPILESDDNDIVISPPKSFDSPKISNLKKPTTTGQPKPTLRGSKVSFEKSGNENEENFERRRDHFQQKKSLSATDRKGILKVIIFFLIILLKYKTKLSKFDFHLYRISEVFQQMTIDGHFNQKSTFH